MSFKQPFKKKSQFRERPDGDAFREKVKKENDILLALKEKLVRQTDTLF
jgi:hypothetical protein